jgi:hypothetical protein
VDAAAGSGAPGTGGAGTDARLAIDADVSTAEGFCHGFLAVVAEVFARCLFIPEAAAQQLVSDPIFCQRFMASIAAGRTRFDGTHAAACLAELPGAISCDSSMASALPMDCTVVTPLVPTGGACQAFAGVNVSAECMGDDYCRRGTGAARCTGTCTARVALGQACDSSTDLRCAKGATCDGATKRCVADVGLIEGQSCAIVSEPGCATNLFCDVGADGGVAGVCRALKTSGPCRTDSECVRPARCMGPAGAGVCAPTKPIGASCTPNQHECSLFDYCGAGNVCSEQRSGVGAACGEQNGEAVPCDLDAYCDGAILGAGTCRALKQPGDACDPTVLLACGGNFATCDATARVCVDCPL